MKTTIQSAIIDVEEIIDGIVSYSGNGGAIYFPKKFSGRKVKVLLLKEKGGHIGFRMARKK